MLNSIFLFFSVNYFKILGLVLSIIAIMIIFALIFHSATKRNKRTTIIILSSLTPLINLVYRLFIYLWLVATLIVVLGKVLVF